MNKFRKLNLILIPSSLVASLAAYFLFLLDCFSDCSLEFLVGFLRPAFFLLASLFVFCLILLFFPSQYFKNWLLYIASWYFPLTVYCLSQISVYSSNVLSMDRGPAALWLMGILGIITIIYIFITKKKDRIKSVVNEFRSGGE